MARRTLGPVIKGENFASVTDEDSGLLTSSTANVSPKQGSSAGNGRRPRKRVVTAGRSKLEWVHADAQTVASGQTQDNRRLVRSHAMADHRRKKRLQDIERYQTKRSHPLPLRLVQPLAPGQNGGRIVPLPWVDRFQEEADNKDSISSINKEAAGSTNESPWTYVGQGSGDPFSMMSTNLSGRMQNHLHYFVNVLVPMSYPLRSANRFRLQSGWGPLAQANAVLMHAMISTACTAYAMWTGDFMGPDMDLRRRKKQLSPAALDSFYHKAETVRLVNEKLNSPVEAAADATIAAVAILITVETLTGNLDQVRIHLNGLREMVTLRGDLSSLPLTVISQIATTDIKISIVCLTKPIFPFVKPVRRSRRPIPAADAEIARLACSLLNLPNPGTIFHADMMQVFHDLAEMTRYAELVRRQLPTDVEEDADEDFFDTQNLFIEYRLLSYRFDEVTGAFKGDNSIEGCCRLATLLYVNTVLWIAYTPAAAVLRSPIGALKVALETLDESLQTTFWAPYSDILAWVLFLGAHCSKDQVERRFFILELAKVVVSIGWRDLEEMRQTLMGFFYVDRVYATSLVEIWEEVQVLISRWK